MAPATVGLGEPAAMNSDWEFRGGAQAIYWGEQSRFRFGATLGWPNALAAVLRLIEELQPAAIVETAAQPSHDRAAAIPFDDFDTNAVGTLNMIEATRRFAAEAPFVHMSTNKVYGDAPNELKLVEHETRWDYADSAYANGIPETFRIDASKHSLFGASKVAADVMVQEYGR